MKPEIVVMLTHHDVTVNDARDVFRACKDLPAGYWGFKDSGLTHQSMAELVDELKGAGKIAVLEAVSFDDEELVRVAKLAAACGVDYFTGSRFTPEVAEIAHAADMKYFPFCGEVGGPPITLAGEPDEIIENATRLCESGADGVDLVAFRYSGAEPLELAQRVVDEVGAHRVIVAGSINSLARVGQMRNLGPFAYTMGGALFESVFVPGGTFRDNLTHVIELTRER